MPKPEFKYPDGFLDDDLPRGALSPSSFNSYRRCPRQYMYSYVEGLISPPGVAMLKGTAIHKGAEVVHQHTIDTGELMSLEEASQEISDTFDEEAVDLEDSVNADGDPVQLGPIKDSAIKNFKVYYRDAVPKIHPVAVEKPVMAKVGDVPMRGFIDLVDAVEDEWGMPAEDGEEKPLIEVVSDLKTTTKLWQESKINN